MDDDLNNLEEYRCFSKKIQEAIHREDNPAEYIYERLIEEIQEFEEALDADMQAGFKYVSFGETVYLIDDIGYWNPDIIIFYGSSHNGSPVQLVQHITQLNLLLIAVKRPDTSRPRRKIGFSSASQED
ncbi:MAG: hypothetical protein H6Q72_1420 [Firmicutes bacterium]|nr:hypothetical protein [Bacillota bacterium]